MLLDKKNPRYSCAEGGNDGSLTRNEDTSCWSFLGAYNAAEKSVGHVKEANFIVGLHQPKGMVDPVIHGPYSRSF